MFPKIQPTSFSSSESLLVTAKFRFGEFHGIYGRFISSDSVGLSNTHNLGACLVGTIMIIHWNFAIFSDKARSYQSHQGTRNHGLRIVDVEKWGFTTITSEKNTDDTQTSRDVCVILVYIAIAGRGFQSHGDTPIINIGFSILKYPAVGCWGIPSLWKLPYTYIHYIYIHIMI